MARRDRPAEQGQEREMPRRDRGAGMDDEDVRREGGRDIRGVNEEDELGEEDEFDEDEPEEFDEDEEEGIR